MRTKEEVIKEHFLKNISEEDFKKLTIREDGYAIMYNNEGAQLSPNFMFLGLTQDYVYEYINSGIDTKTNEMVWRPESLSGIEDNQGWIRIESEEDLPKEGMTYYLICVDGIPSIHPHNIQQIKSLYVDGIITHYQAIVKPKPPLY